MRVLTAGHIGALLAERRRELGLTQAAVARQVGASRQWLAGVEHGNPRAELALVLRAMHAVGIVLTASPGQAPTVQRAQPA